jgi:uncharacterized repeat protein (TIGR02543 family)
VQATLTVNIAGSGSVTREPDQPTYALGAVVTLTATPAPGWSFSAWSGDLISGANPATITINSNTVVTATFTQNLYTLTTLIVGSGNVARNPDQAPYVYGTVVTLTATPAAGWSFAGWSGDLTNAANPATITIDGNKTVTANFAYVNRAPIANAGPDQTVYVNSTVTLNGSASYDPDNNLPLTFGWSPVTLGRALSVTTFTAPATPQVLTFTLIVTDSLGLASTPDTVVVTVSNYYLYLPIVMHKTP